MNYYRQRYYYTGITMTEVNTPDAHTHPEFYESILISQTEALW